MNKKLWVVCILIVILLVVFYVLALKLRNGRNLIGGQKDEHGCIIPAGYSWCEAKQKCLRTWEEKCESPSSTDISEWSVYRNTNFGFELKFPKSWDGYQVHEGVYPNYSYVSFSFSGNHQPFTIFQIVRRTSEQWVNIGGNPGEKILDKSSYGYMVCDGCCDSIGDFTGGGQFDIFQVARCKEAPEIIKTFQLIN